MVFFALLHVHKQSYVSSVLRLQVVLLYQLGIIFLATLQYLIKKVCEVCLYVLVFCSAVARRARKKENTGMNAAGTFALPRDAKSETQTRNGAARTQTEANKTKPTNSKHGERQKAT